MGVSMHSKSNGAKFLEAFPKVKQQLQQARWLQFFEKFDGHDKDVTNSFSWAYDGIEGGIGDIKLVLIESFMAKAT